MRQAFFAHGRSIKSVCSVLERLNGLEPIRLTSFWPFDERISPLDRRPPERISRTLGDRETGRHGAGALRRKTAVRSPPDAVRLERRPSAFGEFRVERARKYFD
jgi:hypothetical protein